MSRTKRSTKHSFLTAIGLLLAILPMPAGASPTGDLSAAVVVTEATGVEDETLGRLLNAVDLAARDTALRMRAEPKDIELLLRSASDRPRSCGAAAPCVTRLGQHLGVRYMIALGAASFGGSIVFTLDVFDIQREVTIGHADGSWQRTGDIGPIAADAVARSLPVQLRRRQSTLVLAANEDGVMVTLDGESLGRTPLDPVSVPPGEHRVLFEKAGFIPYRQRLTTEPGGRARVEATLQRIPEPPAPAAPEIVAPTKSYLPAVLTAGAGIAGIGSGLAFTVAMRGNERKYFTECTAAFGDACNGPRVAQENPRMAELRQKIERQDLIATVSFGVAAAAAVTTAVILYLDPPVAAPAQPRPEDDELLGSLRFAPWPGGASVVLSGSF